MATPRWTPFTYAVLAACSFPPGPLGAETTKVLTGVVVEEVAKGSAGEKTGLQPGDILLSWSRVATPPANPTAAQGKIDSPFVLGAVATEEAPRGAVILAGLRGGKTASWELGPGAWGIRARPRLPTALLATYQEGSTLAAKKEITEASGRWDAAATTAGNAGDHATAAWILARSGALLADARMSTEADRAYGKAVREGASAGPMITGQLLREWGGVFEDRSEWDRAEDCYRRALSEDQKGGPEGLTIARDTHLLGDVKWDRGDLPSAKDLYSQALAMRERLAPDSLAVAQTLNNLGNVAGDSGDAAKEEEYHQRALAIREGLAPASLEVAASLTNLGVAARNRGELSTAQDNYQRAYLIYQRLAPESLNASLVLSNIASVARARGNLAVAEDIGARALHIQETVAPGSLAVARTLSNLANVAHDREDLVAAEDYERRALGIRQKLASGSLDEALSLGGLGWVLQDLGDLESATKYYEGALAIRERLAPESWSVASSLGLLGEVFRLRGDIMAAEQYQRRALAIREKLAPNGLETTFALNNLADMARARGEYDAAAALFLRSLEVQHRLAAGSSDEARTLHGLGVVYRHAGRPEATEYLCRAVDALEEQKTKLGGTQESKGGFAAKYADYYRVCAEALVRSSRAEEAFHVLERFRARSLLAMLAERDLVFSADVPADLGLERKRTDATYDRTQEDLSKLNPTKDSEQVEKLLGHLRELRAKQGEIAGKIKQASPRFAALQYPEPLDLGGVRSVLDPGTAYLAYSVGENETLLFVVKPTAETLEDGLKVFVLPVTEKALRERVQAFRSVLERGDRDRSVLNSQAAELYDLLVKPAENSIASSSRLLVSPDGPLHTLPFACLVRRDAGVKKGRGGRNSTPPAQYLVEWKPLHTVISATVYAELRRARRDADPSSATLVAFGDPTYAMVDKDKADETANPVLRSAIRGGASFTPLPATRTEVETIAGLYPEHVHAYLGEDATEERAKGIGTAARYVHFATHGYLNERFPLDSALVFSLPDKVEEGHDNGFLQAWEVFEKVRIDADLVVLSACETALGKESGGEGLVGLTRAFQYAGARSILASLWSVSDESTSDLMKRFYTYLKAGKTKDEALRSAQVDLIHGTSASHPFHWAAFQLIGDWR